MNEYLLLALIAAFGGFTQGLAGVGVILVALPLMALFVDIKTVIPLVNLLGLSINIVLWLQLRRSMHTGRIFKLILAAIPGIPVGVYILKTVPVPPLQLLLGVVLIGYVVHAFSGGLPKREPASWWTYPAGFTAGCLGGSLGASGPPIIIYTSLQPWTKDEIKSTMVGYFLLSTVFISSMHAFTGLITKKVLVLYSASLPGLALGMILGMVSYGHINDQTYKRLMLWLVLILGLILLWKGRSTVL